MSAVFELRNVTKRFRREVALDSVSLTGERGMVVALLGENGAGKTTALRILLGLLRADAGEAEVLGMDSRRQGLEIRRRVGYVPDRPAVYEWMTVAEIGWFASGFYPTGYLQRYRQLIQRFRLPEDRKLRALSKGMLAKVSLALAMAHEPELLILDEPTSGLDPVVRREFLESMVDVAAAGRTVLLSSHQVAEVERVADVVALLHHGRLTIVETMENLKESVREVVITSHDISLQPPELPKPAVVMSAHRQDRDWRLLARNLDDDMIAGLQSDAGVRHVQVRHPSLEEILVSLMQPDESRSVQQSTLPLAESEARP